MKARILVSFVAICFFSIISYGQSPEKLNYQAVVRDVSGNPIQNSNIGVRLSVLQGSASGTAVCIEEFSPTTNDYGFVTLEIGSVNLIDFEAIDWSAGPYYMKIELDEAGGTNYSEMGTSQLISVPYALHAKTAGGLSGDLIWENTGSNIYYNDGNVGVGTTNPLHKFDVRAALHTQVVTDNDLFISNMFSYHDNGLLVHTGYGDGIDIARFSSIGFGFVEVPRMVIKDNGYIGIGTSTPEASLDVSGNAIIRGSIRTEAANIEINEYGTGDRFAHIDFHGDDDTDDFSFRLIRYNTGPNAISKLFHRGTGPLQFYAEHLAPIDLYTAATHRMRIDPYGRIGIGTETPSKTLDVAGDVKFGNDMTLWEGSKALSFRQDSENSYISNKANFVGNGSTENGILSLHGEKGITLRYGTNGSAGTSSLYLNDQGNIGVGPVSPNSQLDVGVSGSYSDEEAIFVVRNNHGNPVFEVFNNGVRVTVEDDPSSKGPKGGFAIGGFDPTKAGSTVDFMRISPDSIRFNIANDDSKGPKGGFAIGSFDRTKGPLNEDFMYITPGGSSAGAYNTKLGYKSGYSLTGGLHNVMLGFMSGYNTEGSFLFSKGSRNVFIGNYSGYDNIEGRDNIAIGHEAGMEITGSENIFIGSTAGKYLEGSGNIIIGKWTDKYFGTSESDNFIISNGTEALPMLAGNFNSREMMIDATLYLYRAWTNPITSGYRDMVMTSPGRVGYYSSSARYKENISAMDDMSWFNNILPVEFTYIEDPLKARQYGLIAEEVEKIDPYFVSYNQDNQVETVTYSKFITPLIKVVQNQQSEIDELKNQITQLQLAVEAMME